MRRNVFALCITLLCLILSACSMPASVPDLMQAPRLSAEQEAVNDALKRSLGTGGYTLKYPRSGDFRSAFVFRDIDSDGEDEAIAFYQLNNSSRGTSVNILDMDHGEWRSVYDRPGIENSDDSDYEIDYIQFEHIESRDFENIIIGWQMNSPSAKQISIYTYEKDALDAAKRLDRRYTQSYSNSLTRDMDGDGLMDIALLSRKRQNQPYKLSFVSATRGKIDVTGSYSLGDDVISIENIIFGRLGDSRQALFIDVGLESGEQYATEIVAIADGILLPLINLSAVDTSEAPPTPLPESPGGVPAAAAEEISAEEQRQMNFWATLRSEKILSGDMDGDGIIEVPSSRPLLGYEELAENADELEEKIQYLTTFSYYRNGVMTPDFNACVNLQGQYMLKFPDRWIGKVTLYSENDLTQWRFIKYNGNLSDLSIELLRIKRISKNDYQDRLEVNPILLTPQQNSLYQIYGYLPSNEESELAITERELRSMFIQF